MLQWLVYTATGAGVAVLLKALWDLRHHLLGMPPAIYKEAKSPSPTEILVDLLCVGILKMPPMKEIRTGYAITKSFEIEGNIVSFREMNSPYGYDMTVTVLTGYSPIDLSQREQDLLAAALKKYLVLKKQKDDNDKEVARQMQALAAIEAMMGVQPEVSRGVQTEETSDAP